MMPWLFLFGAVVAAMLGIGQIVAAQSSNADAAWVGMTLTPVGALLPFSPLAAQADGRRAWAVGMRDGIWRFSGDDRGYASTLGGTLIVPVRERTTLSATYAYFDPGAGTASTNMFGVDGEARVWRPADLTEHRRYTSISARASFGFGRVHVPQRGRTWSMTGSLPLRYHLPRANGSQFDFTLAPGYGFAGTKSTVNRQSGQRPMISAAVAWASPDGTVIHTGFQRISRDVQQPVLFGIGVSFAIGH
jgi:hypothetical protein